MWRPEGLDKWDAREIASHVVYEPQDLQMAMLLMIEAGADAMLEALKAKGYRLDMETLGCGFTKDTKAELEILGWWAYDEVADSKRGQGWLVFIPEGGHEGTFTI